MRARGQRFDDHPGHVAGLTSEAASFQRLAASAIRVNPHGAFEYTRAAHGILAEVWTDMEGSGEFPQVLVDRIMEIEHALVAVVTFPGGTGRSPRLRRSHSLEFGRRPHDISVVLTWYR
jgi:hypothetical protein